MRILSSRQLAMFISLAITAGFAVLLFFILEPLWAALLSAAIFAVIFLAIKWMADALVYRRVLDAIQHFRHAKNGFEKRSPGNDDSVEEIFSELGGWASDRKNEIEQLKKLELYR